MLITRRPLALLIAAAFLLAACSSDDDDSGSPTSETQTTTTTASTDDPESDEIEGPVLDRVAGDVCGAVDTWSTAISDAYEATPAALAGADDIEAARGVVVDWMGSMSDHTGALVGELEGIDLDQAEPLEPFVADLAQRFEGLRGIVEDHQAQAEELTTSALGAFRTEVADLVDEFNTALADLPTVFDDLNTSYPSEDLQSALASACEFEPLDDGAGEGDASDPSEATTEENSGDGD